MLLGVTATPSTLLAAAVTAICSLVGLSAGIVLVNWRATVSNTEYRMI
ncbi:hypothetical protein Hlac_3656 (plasmid) [Halorubrum lacusprofundi ATCC 49239]|jgi:hypothetical protein|uniref:Uncharacterized protein n=1 Tax=Halorubrum lacusprofundi (strain ATCC 49239 / DSM 5036 / JCM 8891 / ACAM 34) TaxID=416348 RepID=B9LXG7_HALLT|nr:hypothetical protein Hlac_3656 [Halorubrum lacusprofundi ATCC 49239]